MAHGSHWQTSKDCDQANLMVADEKRLGCAGIWHSSVKIVPFTHTLRSYTRKPRKGPNPAAVNIGHAVRLKDTSIGSLQQ